MKTKASTASRFSGRIGGEKRPRLEERRVIVLEDDESEVMTNMAALWHAFVAVLIGQDETFRKLASILFSFNQRASLPSLAKERILPLLLSGISGTGKTASIEVMRKIYGILPHCYIYWDLSQFSDETKLNQILGAGAGLVGFGEMMTLPKQLESAVKPFVPKYILLHLDELGEAHYRFLSLMINFLETGRLTSTDGVEFLLPEETRLLVVFTANFGYQSILNLSPLDDYCEAQRVILNAMEEHGISKAILGRLPHILPFFPFSRETMVALATEVIDGFFREVDYEYRNYFPCLSPPPCPSILRRVLETHLLDCDRALGMRSFRNTLEAFKRQLFGDIVFTLGNSFASLPLPLPPPQMDSLLITPQEKDRLEALTSEFPHAFTLTTRSQIKKAREKRLCLEMILCWHENTLLASILCNTFPERAPPLIKLKPLTYSQCQYCGGMSRDSGKRISFTDSRSSGAYKILIFRYHCDLCLSDESPFSIGELY